MDENIYKGKIKFEMKCNTKELEFLYIKVTLRPGKENGYEESRVYLVPAMYSRSTDTHQYLNPNSCHSPHITRSLLSSIVSRIRRNCSDNFRDDRIFKETLIEYKAYLMKSGYKEVHIDRKFFPFAVKKKRNKLLRPSIDDNNKKNDHREIKKYRMVADYEPTFPDIFPR